jgi:hypothetical protein
MTGDRPVPLTSAQDRSCPAVGYIDGARSRMGRTNVAVLPVPVCARPMTSRPCIMSGIAFTWMGVGVTYPSARTPAIMLGGSWKLSKFNCQLSLKSSEAVRLPTGLYVSLLNTVAHNGRVSGLRECFSGFLDRGRASTRLITHPPIFEPFRPEIAAAPSDFTAISM